VKLTVKSALAQVHLWLGLASGLVVFIVALTGSILVFEHELEPLIESSFHTVSVPDDQRRVPIDQLVDAATQQFGNKEVSRIIVEPQPNRTVVVELRQSKKPKDILAVALNPYTGKVVDSRQEEDAFFSVVLRLHRYLCLGDTGKIITGLSCSAFLIIMLSGLVMWWPNRKTSSQRFRVKWNASFKRLNWDLHAVLGFYALPFVFLIASTGLIWSYKWVNNLLFIAFDGKPQQKREAPTNLSAPNAHQSFLLENLYAQTNRQLPHPGKVQISFPEKDNQAITVSKANDAATVSNIVDFLYFDTRTSNLIGQRLYDAETNGFKARRLIFPIHTGSLLGWPTQLIALVIALLTATLPVTGFLIWWGKRKKKPALKHRRQSTGNPRPHLVPVRKPLMK
jgi:uncharacterized iron-regulated membrane protein